MWQNEESLSDGALRLIGLLWTLMERKAVTLLEEPELSFNEGIVCALPSIFARTVKGGKKSEAQIMLTTHSQSLLEDESIDGREVLVLTIENEGTKVGLVNEKSRWRSQIAAGLSIAEVVLPELQNKKGQFSLSFLR